jgi:hypothetical protein
MNDEKEKQEKKGHLAGWIGMLTAIAAILGAVGFNQFFPDVVKRYIFGSASQSSSPSIPSPSLSSSPSVASAPTPSVAPVSTPSVTPPPKPSETPTPPPSTSIQTKTSGNSSGGSVTWELQSCSRNLKTVRCAFTMSTGLNGNIGLGASKIIDIGGNEYSSGLIQVGKRKAGAGSYLLFELIKGATYDTTIDFTEVPNSVTRIIALKVGGVNGGSQVEFQDISISSN